MKIYFISLFLIPMSSYGQEVMYGQLSLETMISNFDAAKAPLAPANLIEGFQTNEVAIVTNDNLLPLSYSKANRKDYQIKWALTYTPSSGEPMKRTLTLVQIKGKDATSLMNELTGKYGRNSKGIPATWYSGKINVLLCPHNLFGEIVSKQKVELTVSEGIITSQINIPIKKGNMENVPKDGMVTLDGCWYDTMQYQNLEPLDEFINRKLVKSPIRSCTLSLLLVTDEQGKESGYVLTPKKNNTKEEKSLIDDLIKRISQLPPWSFGWLETINGDIFQGRYLKAVYSSETGWKFQDYVNEYSPL